MENSRESSGQVREKKLINIISLAGALALVAVFYGYVYYVTRF